MSILWQPIDYENLEELLKSCIEEDNLYKLQNDAKIRAVEQKVPTYEHFRQMVNGAHLKPLERNDTNKKNLINWNHFTKSMEKLKCSGNDNDKRYNYYCNNESKMDTVNRFSSSKVCDYNELSSTAKEFNYKWRSLSTPEDKFNFLKDVHNLLPKIFSVEIPTTILCEILDSLNGMSGTEDTAAIVDILTAITQCNRFELAVTFMSSQDKLTYQNLFHNLTNRNQNNPCNNCGDHQNNNNSVMDIINLAEKYQIHCTYEQ